MKERKNKNFDNNELGTFALVFAIVSFILSLILSAVEKGAPVMIFIGFVILVFWIAGFSVKCACDSVDINLNKGISIASIIACISIIIGFVVIFT